MRQICVAILILASWEAGSAQVITGRILDSSWNQPFPGAQVELLRGAVLIAGAVSSSAGVFRVSNTEPGSVLLRVSALCMVPLEVQLTSGPEDEMLDLGVLVMQHFRPRLQLDHNNCSPTREEDQDTRLLLSLAEADSTWQAFAGANLGAEMPVSSAWLKWGATVSLFGAERTILSPLEVGASGLVHTADRITHSGPYLWVGLSLSGDLALLTVAVREGFTPLGDYCHASFARGGGKWSLQGAEVRRQTEPRTPKLENGGSVKLRERLAW